MSEEILEQESEEEEIVEEDSSDKKIKAEAKSKAKNTKSDQQQGRTLDKGPGRGEREGRGERHV